MTIRRLVRNDYELQDAADTQGVGLEDAARDLALLSVMASLSEEFGDRIVFKGGAVLRFGHGASRTSRDADATVTRPAKAPIPAEAVMSAIASARMAQFLTYDVPADPATRQPLLTRRRPNRVSLRERQRNARRRTQLPRRDRTERHPASRRRPLLRALHHPHHATGRDGRREAADARAATARHRPR